MLQEKLAFLKGKYSSLNQSVQGANLAGFKSWMADNAAPDFSLRSSEGNLVDRAATLTMMRNEFIVLRTVKSSTFKLSNLSVHEDHLSISVKTHLDAITMDGSRIVEDSLAVDTWKSVHGKWKLSTIVTTKDKFSLNGKVTRSTGINLGEAFP